jgi:23S rRNA-/tRNA-specific pseudouridylate synthase/cold shock CspA family protein
LVGWKHDLPFSKLEHTCEDQSPGHNQPDMLLANGVAMLLLPLHRCPAPQMRSELVVEEGEGWLIVNKPRGMIVHDGPGSLIASLVNAGHQDATPCHRLDADTSGLMLVSVDPERTGQLVKCLADPQTTKSYRGIVKGVLKGSGVWSQPISPKPEGRRNPRGFAKDRVEAATGYAALASTPFLTAVDFALGTGRTHQIRKHAATKGHFIVGDTRYGDPKHATQMSKRFGFEGMALHAAALSISLDGAPREFTAPLPPEWSLLLGQFGELPTDSPATAALRRSGGTQLKAEQQRGGGTRYSGEVASWNARKGYGFIRREGRGLDNLYVHNRAIGGDGFRSLRKGESVMFEVSEMEDGKLEAVRVTGPGGEPVLGGQARAESATGAVEMGASDGALPPGAYPPKK